MNFHPPALLLDICQGEFRTKRGRAPNRHTGNPLDKCKGTKKDLPEKYSIGNIFRKGTPGMEDKILEI